MLLGLAMLNAVSVGFFLSVYFHKMSAGFELIAL